jgi:hypothetical protein
MMYCIECFGIVFLFCKLLPRDQWFYFKISYMDMTVLVWYIGTDVWEDPFAPIFSLLSRFPQNTGTHVLNYTVCHPRKQ